jgi:excisionase family DNA binding protein
VKLLTIEDVAEMLTVSKDMVRKLVHRREVDVVKIGKLVRFKKEDIEKLIKTGIRKKEEPN